MQSKSTNMLRVILGLALTLALMAVDTRAQQPSPSPTKSDDAKTQSSTTTQEGEDAGNYTVISSMEFGFRGISVSGNDNKYRSDLNYKAGPRVFDTTFLMKSKEGRSTPFDTFLLTTTGWGADPYGNLRIVVEKPEWYRFNGNYRRFKYYRFLNNFANPNYATRPTNPITGQHGYDTRTQIGDFDLTILPNNQNIRFNVGFSPERYYGPVFTTWHFGGDDFMLLSEAKYKANDFRVGADGKLGPIDFSFLQGFRRFTDESFIDNSGITNLGANPGATNALLTNFARNQDVRGSVNFTRLSLHTLIARKLDITGRLIYSKATTEFGFSENFTGRNWNTRISGLPTTYNPPNILNNGLYNFTGNANRPQTLGDIAVTYIATSKLRISNSFRVETFEINGADLYNAAFFFTRTTGATLAPIIINNGGAGYDASRITEYRKFQNTIEGDYDFNDRYSIFFGYRYGARRIREVLSGFNLGSNLPAPLTTEDHTVENHTNTFFGGFKARPVRNWTLNFFAERGTADNVFTRLGNYDFTNFRVRSRYAPTRRLSFSLSFTARDNSNPSEINGVSLLDFGVNTKSRVFNSSVDWTPNSRFSFSGGYSYNWLNSDAIIEYYYTGVRHPQGQSLYFMRNNFFYLNTSVQLAPRVMLYAAYRINKDTGQGGRLADPTGTPGILITSYPMSFQSPEARLSIKLNRWLDWNVGYQYYNYRESPLVSINPQNYHAHLPYTSLRIYFGRKE